MPQVRNYPSVYGGYGIFLLLRIFGCESSLHVRRVRELVHKHQDWPGIIPPCTEGTAARACGRRQSGNHPSMYGGYSSMSHSRRQHHESSLHVRRVRADSKSLQTERKNHPSMYGGYDQVFAVHVLQQRIIPPCTEGTCASHFFGTYTVESSLHVRRVHIAREYDAGVEGIIPPCTEGTML